LSHDDDDDDDDKGGGREIMCARLTAASARNRKMVQILALVLGSTIHIIMEDYNIIMEHIRDGTLRGSPSAVLCCIGMHVDLY